MLPKNGHKFNVTVNQTFATSLASYFYKNMLPLAVFVTRKSYLGQHWSNHQCRAPHKLIINTVSVDILWKSEKWENSNLIYFFQKSIYN